MTTSWIKHPDIFPAGDVGGDLQMDDGFNVRFRAEDLPYALVDENWYVERSTQDSDDPDVRYHVTCQTQYLICSDPDDPGGTELWSDYEYAPSVVEHYTVELAHDQARRDAANSLADDITWQPLDDHWETIRDAYQVNGLQMPH